MSTSSAVKSPTSVEVVPTLTLAPAVLIRTWSRSGKVEPGAVRVQKVRVAPSCKVRTGVRSQLLIVPAPVVLLKLQTAKEFVVPPWAAPRPLPGAPWVQVDAPSGSLLLSCAQPAPKIAGTLSKPSVSAGAQVGEGVGVPALADGEAVALGVADAVADAVAVGEAVADAVAVAVAVGAAVADGEADGVGVGEVPPVWRLMPMLSLKLLPGAASKKAVPVGIARKNEPVRIGFSVSKLRAALVVFV
jgi:hypothetical protein